MLGGLKGRAAVLNLLPGTHKLVITILWHTKKYILFFARLTKK